jgi:hypothetical protein
MPNIDPGVPMETSPGGNSCGEGEGEGVGEGVVAAAGAAATAATQLAMTATVLARRGMAVNRPRCA